MNRFMKVSIIIALIVGILTFSVSIPVNLLGTSLVRSGAAFLFFILATGGAYWIFHRFGDQKTDTTQPHTGQQVDLKTPEDHVTFDDLYASADRVPDSDHIPNQEEPFEPLSAPQLDPAQLADVIRKKS